MWATIKLYLWIHFLSLELFFVLLLCDTIIGFVLYGLCRLAFVVWFEWDENGIPWALVTAALVGTVATLSIAALDEFDGRSKFRTIPQPFDQNIVQPVPVPF